MNKLISTSKKLDKAFNIAQIVFFALAVAIAALVGLTIAGYLMGFDTGTFGEGYVALNFDFLELRIADGFAPSGSILWLEAAIMLTLCSACLLIGYRGIRYIRGILQPMTLGQPFDGAVSVNLKKLAVLGVILGVAFNCMGLAEQLFMVYAYDAANLLTSDKITQVSVNFTVDLSFLVYCAFLLLLSYVFHYGEELQQLSDETL